MKLFGNKHGAREIPVEEELPVLQDKSLHRGEEMSDDAQGGVLLRDLGVHSGQEAVEVWLTGDQPEETAPSGVEEIQETGEEAESAEPMDAEMEEPQMPEAETAEDTDGEEDEEPEDEDDEPAGMPLWKKSLISFGVCILVLGVAAGVVVNYFLGLINYQSADSDYFVVASAPSQLEEEVYEDSYLRALDEADKADDLEATPEQLERWNAYIDKITSDDSTYEIPISEDVYNILLIGTDNRSEGEVGRSDVMMIASINQKTKKIYLTSFLRDCYVYIPGYGNTRLNHAYAYGGPALLMETLETNFKVHIDKYAMVDFFSFMDVIDILGGVWIPMSSDEVKVANQYIWSMNKLMGEDWDTDYLWGEGYGESGWRLLNGKQALAHARNRYTGSDYERTARQRMIINQIIDGAMQATPATLVDLAQAVLPQITTDMTKSEILSYAANIAAYIDYDVEQLQIPAAGTYSGATISGMSVISLDLDDNIAYLQDKIYAGTEYAD